MFRVVWLQSALQELAAYWSTADPARRAAITSAADQIDRELRDSPETCGESRESNMRIHFIEPLAITFEVHTAEQVVVVLHIRVYRRREN